MTVRSDPLVREVQTTSERQGGANSQLKESRLKLTTSDGAFLYPYDKRMCYFDTLIEKF